MKSKQGVLQDTCKILLAKYELKTLTNELIQCYSKVGWKSTKTNNQTENFVSLKRIIRLSFKIRKKKVKILGKE